jgi:carbonic anhydrase
MDARLDPARALGLEPGHAHILRNAGGRHRTTPSARSSSRPSCSAPARSV